MDQLRAELAERSPCEASSCPSWARCVTWLRANDHAQMAEWLELTLTGPRREGDRQRLRAAARVLAARDPMVEQLWRGELGWSLWFGPFVLAYVGPKSPDLPRLREVLGPHAMLLTDERAWIDGDVDRWRLVDLQPGVPLLLARTLPGAQQPICERLLHELREQVGNHALDGRALQWRGRGFWRSIDIGTLPEGGRAVVSCGSGESLRAMHWEAVRALEAVAVVGPPELLSRWPQPGRTQPCFTPLPSFERRYQQLAAARPDLFAQLRAELDERSIEQAHTCPSWTVYGDWLLEQGEELHAEWLRAELASGEPLRPSERRKFTNALAPVRPSEAAALRRLWGEEAEGARARSIWLGPYMLSYCDPQLLDGIGADELQAILGRHAAFLPRARVHTRIDRQWIDRAMSSRGKPTLAPTPPRSTELLGMVLLELHEGDDDGRGELAMRVRVATPGSVMEAQPEREFATNIGPIAADREATAVICCETEADVRRHAKLWSHLQTFEHVVLLGTPEVLAHWPHAGEWIEPWGASL
jgi:hypothetical protein